VCRNVPVPEIYAEEVDVISTTFVEVMLVSAAARTERSCSTLGVAGKLPSMLVAHGAHGDPETAGGPTSPKSLPVP